MMIGWKMSHYLLTPIWAKSAQDMSRASQQNGDTTLSEQLVDNVKE